MAFEFTEEQEMFRESVREFGERKIAPIAIEMEETKEIPLDVIKGMAELGLLACTASPDYGGSGLDAVSAGVIAEELGRVDPTGSIPVFYLIQASWGFLLNKYGTEEAKQEIFPKVVKGDWFLGIAIDLPNLVMLHPHNRRRPGDAMSFQVGEEHILLPQVVAL